MTLFWLIGAALAAGVLALVLRPLLSKKGDFRVSRRQANVAIYRDQLRELDADLRTGTLAAPDYERARRELEIRLLEDAKVPEQNPARPASRAVAWAVLFGVPVCAAAFYFAVGNPAALAPRAEEHAATAQQLEAMIARLAARLRENPDDVDGWKLLGRSYVVFGRFPEAADAYAKAAVRAPRDPQLLADLADVLAVTRGRRLEGEPEKLVLHALELDPQNLKALALAGTAAFERKDYAAAAAHWQKMLPLVPPDSDDARSIRSSIDEARMLAGSDARPPAGKRELKGTVSLSSKLRAKAAPEDTVFIIARAAEGPPMPLAVKRVKARELPLAFALDDSMAMAPGMNLSAHPRVVIVARVSRSGSAAAQPGDLQGASAPVANDAAGVSVVIDSVVP